MEASTDHWPASPKVWYIPREGCEGAVRQQTAEGISVAGRSGASAFCSRLGGPSSPVADVAAPLSRTEVAAAVAHPGHSAGLTGAASGSSLGTPECYVSATLLSSEPGDTCSLNGDTGWSMKAALLQPRAAR